MSTYVPGVETYLPDIKPFTPDYKFLSSALQTRQDKYNRNWSEANSLYNKIVYAPLSREDNLDKRINVVYLNTKLYYSLNFPKLLSLFFPNCGQLPHLFSYPLQSLK